MKGRTDEWQGEDNVMTDNIEKAEVLNIIFARHLRVIEIVSIGLQKQIVCLSSLVAFPDEMTSCVDKGRAVAALYKAVPQHRCCLEQECLFVR